MKMKQNVRKNILYKMMNPAAPTLVSRGCPYFSYERNANANAASAGDDANASAATDGNATTVSSAGRYFFWFIFEVIS